MALGKAGRYHAVLTTFVVCKFMILYVGIA